MHGCLISSLCAVNSYTWNSCGWRKQISTAASLSLQGSAPPHKLAIPMLLICCEHGHLPAAVLSTTTCISQCTFSLLKESGSKAERQVKETPKSESKPSRFSSPTFRCSGSKDCSSRLPRGAAALARCCQEGERAAKACTEGLCAHRINSLC